MRLPPADVYFLLEVVEGRRGSNSAQLEKSRIQRAFLEGIIVATLSAAAATTTSSSSSTNESQKSLPANDYYSLASDIAIPTSEHSSISSSTSSPDPFANTSSSSSPDSSINLSSTAFRDPAGTLTINNLPTSSTSSSTSSTLSSTTSTLDRHASRVFKLKPPAIARHFNILVIEGDSVCTSSASASSAVDALMAAREDVIVNASLAAEFTLAKRFHRDEAAMAWLAGFFVKDKIGGILEAGRCETDLGS